MLLCLNVFFPLNLMPPLTFIVAGYVDRTINMLALRNWFATYDVRSHISYEDFRFHTMLVVYHRKCTEQYWHQYSE